MSRDQLYDQQPLESIEQLVQYFHDGAKPAKSRGVGTEHEKFLFREPDFGLVEFDGPGGIEELFGKLATRYGWAAERDRERLVALARTDEAITLEPGGQVELSGGVKKTIHETCEEFDRHLEELAAVCGPEYRSVSFGLNPWDNPEVGGWVPKSRYAIMRRYLGGQGDLAHWMMKETCTIQANLDYTSEKDAVDIVRTATSISPIVNALFANSPIRNGEPTGMQSFRAHIWTRTDNDRSGVPEFMHHDDWGFADWVEWVLDVPMFFIRRPSGYIDLAGKSFREFMRDGYDGEPATMGDFELHISTAFPEVRLKKFIEVRSADGGPRSHVCALSALWKGVLYDLSARRAAATLIGAVTPGDHAQLMEIAARDGIRGVFRGQRLSELAAELVQIAGDGLRTLSTTDGTADESEFLEPLQTILDSGESAADKVLRLFREHSGDRRALLDELDLLSRY